VKHSELDKEFLAHEKHLWQVLAALSRAGYFVPPQDARDLIHDFYLEEWAGVVQRYDSALSQFPTYLSAAFYRFARRRILTLRRWRQRTVELEEAVELGSSADLPEQVVERQQQIGLIRTALGNLPAQERAILYDFLTSGEPNERALAQQHSMTRYRLRDKLASGLGRLLIELSGDAAPATMDARVAKALWLDGQSPHRVGALLGITTPEVNAARLRFVAELTDSLRQFNHQSKPSKDSHEPRSRDTENGAEFCR
jgi:RNA polymerase sigma factor (sigma-70 family)